MEESGQIITIMIVVLVDDKLYMSQQFALEGQKGQLYPLSTL